MSPASAELPRSFDGMETRVPLILPISSKILPLYVCLDTSNKFGGIADVIYYVLAMLGSGVKNG